MKYHIHYHTRSNNIIDVDDEDAVIYWNDEGINSHYDKRDIEPYTLQYARLIYKQFIYDTDFIHKILPKLY